MPGGAAAATTPPPQNVTVQFDRTEAWTVPFLFAAALHEIGHVLACRIPITRDR